MKACFYFLLRGCNIYVHVLVSIQFGAFGKKAIDAFTATHSPSTTLEEKMTLMYRYIDKQLS
jgi:hypothetical protein